MTTDTSARRPAQPATNQLLAPRVLRVGFALLIGMLLASLSVLASASPAAAQSDTFMCQFHGGSYCNPTSSGTNTPHVSAAPTPSGGGNCTQAASASQGTRHGDYTLVTYEFTGTCNLVVPGKTCIKLFADTNSATFYGSAFLVHNSCAPCQSILIQSGCHAAGTISRTYRTTQWVRAGQCGSMALRMNTTSTEYEAIASFAVAPQVGTGLQRVHVTSCVPAAAPKSCPAGYTKYNASLCYKVVSVCNQGGYRLNGSWCFNGGYYKPVNQWMWAHI